MYHVHACRWGCLLLLAFCPAVASAQSTVKAQGAVELSKPPEALRVQLDLRAKGKTLSEALAKLKERQTRIQAQLLVLGAVKQSIQAEEVLVIPSAPHPPPSAEVSGLPEPAPQLVVQDTAAPKVVVVALFLRAEWQLNRSNPIELLAQAHELQDKIRQLDLDGNKSGSPAAEKEASTDKPCNCGCKGSEPVFVYVARFTEEERARALTEAFARVRTMARRLAHAAGAEVGPLHQLVEQGSPAEGRLPGIGGQGLPAEMDTASGEVFAVLPGRVTVRIALTACFRLVEPSNKSK